VETRVVEILIFGKEVLLTRQVVIKCRPRVLMLGEHAGLGFDGLRPVQRLRRHALMMPDATKIECASTGQRWTQLSGLIESLHYVYTDRSMTELELALHVHEIWTKTTPCFE